MSQGSTAAGADVEVIEAVTGEATGEEEATPPTAAAVVVAAAAGASVVGE
jgi:hypothetical protein